MQYSIQYSMWSGRDGFTPRALIIAADIIWTTYTWKMTTQLAWGFWGLWLVADFACTGRKLVFSKERQEDDGQLYWSIKQGCGPQLSLPKPDYFTAIQLWGTCILYVYLNSITFKCETLCFLLSITLITDLSCNSPLATASD